MLCKPRQILTFGYGAHHCIGNQAARMQSGVALKAPHTAYVHRWANALYAQLSESLADIAEPQQRLVTGITESLALVRQNPALAYWFAKAGPPIGAEMAESDMITVMVSAFVRSLGTDQPQVIERRARWVVRVLTPLLLFAGRDPAAERASQATQ